ncbi:hypothetical protein GX51_07774 [Blastomyces parvus]|uniref:Uncharacterized protein n=1 Tax=Blastomyces parvus TaxID=2060905 RepID=A0A2B7WJ48_9EURO|nr:hypothetical protein GX51_07774 [Blastomyces parvus]
MRWLRGLVLALCIVESSAHPTPEGTTDIAQRNPSPIAGAELDWPLDSIDEKITGTDISPRANDVGNFRKYAFITLKLYSVLNGGVHLYELVENCGEFNVGAKNAFNCIWAAISSAVGIAVLVDSAIPLRGRIAKGLALIPPYPPGLPRFNKREEILELEDELSSLLSIQVRHLGIWDGSDDADDDNEVGSLSKRDNTTEATPRHVFSGNFQGADIHFAYMGQLNNASHFRFGFGPGSDTASNRVRRGNHKFNNQYFKSGGLDFVAVTDPLNNNNPGIYLTKNDKKEFNWIVDQVRCYFSIFDRGLGTKGINFQVFNSWDKTTLAAGAIAPFTKTKKSIIRKLKPKQGVPMIDSCSKRPGKGPIDEPSDKPRDELRRGVPKRKGGKRKKKAKTLSAILRALELLRGARTKKKD